MPTSVEQLAATLQERLAGQLTASEIHRGQLTVTCAADNSERSAANWESVCRRTSSC